MANVDDFGLFWLENSVQVHNVNWYQVNDSIAWLAGNAGRLKMATEVLDKKLHKPADDANIET